MVLLICEKVWLICFFGGCLINVLIFLVVVVLGFFFLSGWEYLMGEKLNGLNSWDYVKCFVIVF